MYSKGSVKYQWRVYGVPDLARMAVLSLVIVYMY